MSDSDIRRGNEKGRAAVLGSYQDDELDAASSSGEFYRLLGIPALAAVLFVGGVYWIRMQVPAGSPGQQSAAVVQVQLLPRPNAVPIAVAPVSRPDTTNVASLADTSLKNPDPIPSDDPVPVPKARTFTPGDVPPSDVMSTPSAVSGPASSAAVKFQQALLRHVSRYQRYPNAARAVHLEGKVVDTQFAMARDGTLLGIWVRTSSGHLLLDKEAIETIRRAQPLPPIPPELPDRLNIHLELEF
ncbi:TonB family protein [Bradyrhizobium japonicum]|uniref:TonB family protein n=1 Tax=Bradyrhizobium japonicum TaxID=375 RepID=UPI001BAE4E67|nr:TonB family protein [Bradyrhizobium japonicum]MBR0960663.1 TonB family protein [Bradyrhizobium japonicum]